MNQLIRPILRRTLVVPLAVCALLVASCGGDGGDADAALDPPATVDDPTAEGEQAPEATGSEEDQMEGGGEATSGDEPAEDAGAGSTVTVATANGEITVPVTTAGIFTLDEWAAQMLLALGVEPVTTANYFSDTASLAVVEDAGVGVIESGNLELVAVEAPAMIIGTGQPPHLEVVDVLEEIAPVVLPDLELASWEDQLRVLAAVTGTEERAEQIIGRVAERRDALAAQVEDSPVAGSSLSILTDFGSGGGFYAFESPLLAATFADDFGLQRPPDQTNDDPSDFGYIEISEELIPSQGADIIISLSGDITGGLSALDNPLLPDAPIEAEVDGTTWAVSTPLSAWWILDDYESILLGDATTHTVDDSLDVWADLTEG
ncbi:MAG: ABC transporter substrate-binding protein [Actinomycetota bacterium]